MALTGLGNVALAVSPYQSATLALLLLVLMVRTAIFGAWPWVKTAAKKLGNLRLRSPLTFAGDNTAAVGGDFFPMTVRQENSAEAIQRRNTEIEELKGRLADAERHPQAGPRYDTLIEELERLRAENRDLKQKDRNNVVNQQIRVKAKALEYEKQIAALLRQSCREMADYLRWFLADHKDWSESDTVDLYHQRFGDRVGTLLEELEQYDMYPPENLKSYERAANAHPRSSMAIYCLAKTLGSIGNKP